MFLIQLILLFFIIVYGTFYYYAGVFPTTEQIQTMLFDTDGKTLIPPDVESTLPPSNSFLNIYKEAAICSDSNICSEIGKECLLKGGSAVDAALATLLCNGLVAMQSMGLGGGFLMQVYSRKERRAYNILSREVAPLAGDYVNLPIFHNSTEFFMSGLSIGVPAEVMGYAEAHEKFGALPWSDLVQPTIDLCHKGFHLTKHQADSLRRNAYMIKRDLWLKQMFVDPMTDEFFKIGTLIKPVKKLCQTYEILGQDGPHSFYKGKLSHDVLEDLKELNSPITARDLSGLDVQVVESEALRLGDNLLYLMPPPGSGHIVGFILNIMESKLKSQKPNAELDTRTLHYLVEALKYAFVKRWQMDTHIDKQFLVNLTCPDYASEIANRIKGPGTKSHAEDYGASDELMARMEMGTAQISVLAPNGDAVSVTSSINFYFGSGRTGRRTGILFNNAMSDFNIPNMPNYFGLPKVNHKNNVKPGQSPMSSMAPLIVTDKEGNVRLCTGAAGGSRIISVLSQILLRVLYFNQDIKEAIDAPRLHHQLMPNLLEYEYGLLRSTIQTLEMYGHRLQRYRVVPSSVCGIERKEDYIYSNADFRKDGGVAGY